MTNTVEEYGKLTITPLMERYTKWLRTSTHGYLGSRIGLSESEHIAALMEPRRRPAGLVLKEWANYDIEVLGYRLIIPLGQGEIVDRSLETNGPYLMQPIKWEGPLIPNFLVDFSKPISGGDIRHLTKALTMHSIHEPLLHSIGAKRYGDHAAYDSYILIDPDTIPVR